ncbi:MAG: energy transducer TonB [Acidobacteria bacterium]|nr:energy transducer TonB [Acidobacteriota bacterium]MBI3424091.1 energy transducer TonB [Acidobacteriota bacterium]
MLPPNFLTIPQIQHERHAGSKLMHLTTLLEYLLKMYNPDVAAADEGREPKVGERVIACQHSLSNFTRVLWALKVRNSFAHVTGNEFNERDHQNAVNCLIEAIGDVCRQPAIPPELKQAIYRDPDADVRGRQVEDERQRREQQAQAERVRIEQSEAAQQARAEALRLEQARLQHARHERELQERKATRQTIAGGVRKLVVLGVLVMGGMFAYPKLWALYKGDKGSATVVRTAAELALKKVREKRKQRDFVDYVNQAEAAWRDGEIEFKRENFKLAEGLYRQVIGSWDGVNARLAETLSFEELLKDVSAVRGAAVNAQAQQKAVEQWRQAEELRRNAMNARKSGNLAEAKNLIVQARQQYEAAQAAAMTETAQPNENGEIAVDTKPAGGSAEAAPTVEPTAAAVAGPTATAEPTVERRPRPAPEQTPARAAEDETFTISEKEFLQYATKRVNAVLPPQAKSTGVAGPVVIRVYLSKYGHLSKAEVVEGEMLLRNAALEALRQWSFRPFLLNRVPTEVQSVITIYVR